MLCSYYRTYTHQMICMNHRIHNVYLRTTCGVTAFYFLLAQTHKTMAQILAVYSIFSLKSRKIQKSH